MYDFTSGQTIAVAQACGILASFALHVLFGLPGWYLLAAAIAVVPSWWIRRRRRRRVLAVEAQVDGLLLALSNALKSTPSLGDAVQSVGPLLADPIRQDLSTAVKAMRLGATLEQALLMMAARIGSRQLDSALTAVLVGRQIGGNLPKILDSTAASLREMARLEGVVRTKTAEGKMQLWVLAVFPLALIGVTSEVNPGYFDPLTRSMIGYGLVSLALLFWCSALVAARKILAVDI
jgi:tight adherence protein B